ncbi:DUF4346 domain-containing protein [Candidatus Beckwithbacteria bacterium]|nr:DUF4346 domain-containing protein [Candidatus Beckwithbacteria bacterium]
MPKKIKTQAINLKNWPLFYKDILLQGDLNSHVGICTLWTERKVVGDLVKDKSLYAVIGNLYSGQGVNAILRNIMANPQIRTIVLWGAELSLSGHSLKKFIENGVDKDNKIIEGRGEIEREITAEYIKQFRENIEVIDLRGKPVDELIKTLKKLKKIKKEPFAKKATIFPPSQPIAQVFPSEQVGFRVEGKTVAQTWLKVINEIYKYGRYKHTRYTQQNELREVLNMMAVITDEDPDKEYFPKYLPFEMSELRAYYPEITTAKVIPGTSYSYGYRMMEHFKVDQIAKIKELIKLRPDSKKMLAITTDPKLDWANANKGDTPCLVMVLGSVQDYKFFLTAHFRSHDMVHGWPRNAFALRKLQKEIADEAKMAMGALTIVSHSAHIYSDDFALVENILSDNMEKELGYTPAVRYPFDKRVNVVIEIIDESQAQYFAEYKKRYEKENEPFAIKMVLKQLPKNNKKLIRATLFAPNGGGALKILEGRTAQEVAYQITDWNYVVDPSHCMYIGQELQRAEECIKNKKKYHQDPA